MLMPKYTSQLQPIFEQSCTYCLINIILQISTDYHVPHTLINIMLPSQGTLELLSYPLLDTCYWLFHTVDT